jgi:hypothetical protein
MARKCHNTQCAKETKSFVLAAVLYDYSATDLSGIILCYGFNMSHFQLFFRKYQLILPVKSS